MITNAFVVALQQNAFYYILIEPKNLHGII